MTSRPAAFRRKARLIAAIAVVLMGAPVPAHVQDLIVNDVTLIDGTGAKPLKHAWVAVRDGRIAKISRAPIRSRGTETVAGRGKFLIPGLIDVHVHLKGGGAWGDKPAPDVDVGKRALRAYLDHGVTTIFDAGNAPAFIYDLRAKERAGEIVAPRIFATGQVFGAAQLRGGGPDATGLPPWPELEARLDRFLASGPDIQKFSFERFGAANGEVIALAPLETMAKLVAHARAKGARTTIHVTEERITRAVVDAGMSTLEHPIVTTPISEDLAQRLIGGKVAFATTLAIFDDTDAMGWPRWTRPMLEIARANVKSLTERGGVAALGSDHFDAAMSHREAVLIAATGLPPLAVIRIATLNGAIFLDRADELGSLKPGKRADMVLLDADPIVDIANLQRIAAVFKDGKRVK